MPDTPIKAEGWAKPQLSKKFHYFRNSCSLCGMWIMATKDLEQDFDEHPQNCATCQRKRLKELGR